MARVLVRVYTKAKDVIPVSKDADMFKTNVSKSDMPKIDLKGACSLSFSENLANPIEQCSPKHASLSSVIGTIALLNRKKQHHYTDCYPNVRYGNPTNPLQI